MEHSTNMIRWREIALDAGEQAVINGALITADQACIIRVADCAAVLTARALWRSDGTEKPGHTLYYATMLAINDGDLEPSTKKELLGLLGRVVIHSRTRNTQEHCAKFAAAISSSDSEGALNVARLLARAEMGGIGDPPVTPTVAPPDTPPTTQPEIGSAG